MATKIPNAQYDDKTKIQTMKVTILLISINTDINTNNNDNNSKNTSNNNI